MRRKTHMQAHNIEYSAGCCSTVVAGIFCDEDRYYQQMTLQCVSDHVAQQSKVHGTCNMRSFKDSERAGTYRVNKVR